MSNVKHSVKMALLANCGPGQARSVGDGCVDVDHPARTGLAKA